MNELLQHVTSSPHIRSKTTTDGIMKAVILALMPATLFGILNFGLRALLIILLSIATSVLTEYVYEKLMHKDITISDGSAVVTGLLLALNLPSTAPWYLPVIGGVFAILIVKQIFGGLGQNIVNPALMARCFLLISFAGKMTDFTPTKGFLGTAADAVSSATPLAALKAGEKVDVLSMFVGNIQGTIGETSVIAILIGAVFLLFIKVIDWRIPLTYIGSFLVFAVIFGGHGFSPSFLAAQLCGGGLMLGAWFMATDYVTTPITKTGQIVYGCIIGILTGLFRFIGGSAEGVSYAIVFSNLLVPLIERVTMPVAFGKEGKRA